MFKTKFNHDTYQILKPSKVFQQYQEVGESFEQSALKISEIPIPSYNERREQIRTPNSPLRTKQRKPKFAFVSHHAEKDGTHSLIFEKQTFAEQWIALLQSKPTTCTESHIN